MRHHLVYTSLYGLFFLLFLQTRGQGQEQKRVSGTFNNYSFARLAEKLQIMTGYRFYYDPSDLDSLSIDVTLNKATVPQVLDELFRNTDLHYAIDSTGRICIGRRRQHP